MFPQGYLGGGRGSAEFGGIRVECKPTPIGSNTTKDLRGL